MMKRAAVGMSGSIAKVLDVIAPWGGMLSAIATPLMIAALCSPLQAQVPPITPEPGTNTNINPDAGNPNQFNITGGQLSGTGTEQNLFHSFQQFGLNSDQTANFIPPNLLPNEGIRNILGRVMGGNPSVINGVIQISSGTGTPNLYLMNPAGIIFGANANLNVPASFTATTATSIGFGNNWFNASGVNSYALLVSSPDAFAFNVNQPGAIVNAANLRNGGDLTLIGGTVVSTGSLESGAGQITIAAVQGTNLVRLSASNNVLSLEVQPIATANPQPGNWVPTVQSLPQLLTGGGAGSATGLEVNSQGQVVLTGSGVQVDSNTGSVTVSGTSNLKAAKDLRLQTQGNLGNLTIQNSQLEAGQDLILQAPQGNIRLENSQLQPFNLSDGRDIQLTGQSITIQQSQLRSLNNMQLVAQNTVQVSDGASPVIIRAGRHLTVQGNQAVNIDALNRPQSVLRTGGNLTLISDGNINGNGRFINDGNFSILNLSGGMGNFRYNAIGSNGIISSAGDVSFGNYEGVSLKVEAGGSITGGNITITEPNTALQGTDSDIAILSTDPALILRAGLTELKNTPNVLPSLTELRNSPTVSPDRALGETTFTGTGVSSSPASITVGNITTATPNGGGPVILSAPGNITTGAITTGGDTSTFDNKDTFGGFVSLSAGGNIQVSTIDTSGQDGGDVTIAAGGLFRAMGTFLVTDAGFGDGITTGSDGRITLPTRDVPTSINATGGLAGGATISIRHGGRSFIVGPAFVTDADGDVVFIDADKNRVSYKDSNGNIVKGSNGLVEFTDINGNQLEFYEVSPLLATPFSVGDIPADASFTAGAITSNQSNKGLSVSFRDRPLIGNGTVVGGGGRISVTSSFISSNGGTDSNVGTGGGTGSGGGIGTSTGTGTNIGTNTGSTTDTGTNNGIDTGLTTDTDASGSNSVQIGTEIFEHQNKQPDRLSHCRTSQEQSEKTTEEEKSDRTDEEDCEKIDFFQRLNSQLTILRIELHLPADAPTQPNSSIPRSSGRN